MSDKYSLTFKAIDEVDTTTPMVSGTDTMLMARGEEVFRVTIADLKTALNV